MGLRYIPLGFFSLQYTNIDDDDSLRVYFFYYQVLCQDVKEIQTDVCINL